MISTIKIRWSEKSLRSIFSLMLPLHLCLFGSWYEAWAMYTHVQGRVSVLLISERNFAQNLICLFWKDETCLSKNRGHVWNLEDVGTATIHPWEALTALRREHQIRGFPTPPFSLRLLSWGDQGHPCQLSWRGSIWGRRKRHARLCVFWCWVGHLHLFLSSVGKELSLSSSTAGEQELQLHRCGWWGIASRNQSMVGSSPFTCSPGCSGLEETQTQNEE